MTVYLRLGKWGSLEKDIKKEILFRLCLRESYQVDTRVGQGVSFQKKCNVGTVQGHVWLMWSNYIGAISSDI